MGNKERRTRSQDFAEVLNGYHDGHRELLSALFDDSVSLDELRERSLRLHEALVSLKRERIELRRKREVPVKDDDTKDPDAST